MGKNKQYNSSLGFANRLIRASNNPFVELLISLIVGFLLYESGSPLYFSLIGFILTYAILYSLGKFGTKDIQKDANNWMKKRIKEGKKPYVNPFLFAFCFGLIFVLMAVTFISKTASFSALKDNGIILVGAFIFGAIMGYFAQIRNIKRFESK